MASTPILPFAVWASGTNQNSVPANDNSRRNQILNGLVISKAVTAQPASPVEGDVYILPATHTGAQWASFFTDDLVIYSGGTWYAFAPEDGVVVNFEGQQQQWTGSAGWVPIAGGGGGGGSGDVVGPGSATADAIVLFDSTTGKLIKDSGETIAAVRRIPQNSQSTAYTLVLADAGKHIFHPSADTTARIWTIPANSSVAFPIGTAVTFVNQNAGGVITIAITTDTMRLAGAGTTGSRTLAANGMATALKVTSTEWIISGAGLT